METVKVKKKVQTSSKCLQANYINIIVQEKCNLSSGKVNAIVISSKTGSWSN